MAKPPKATPNSDIDGVDRDYRPGLHATHPEPDPGAQLEAARKLSKGRPDPSTEREKKPRSTD